MLNCGEKKNGLINCLVKFLLKDIYSFNFIKL